MAVVFDISRLEVKGDPIPVGEGVTLNIEGAAQFDIANNGSLVYVPGGVITQNGRKLVWVDRTGKEEPLAAPPRNYTNPHLSPDGQQVALAVQGANDDVWVYDIAHQTLTRLTFQSRSISPRWTPDGKRIVYRSSRAGILNLFWRAADGSGEEERLTVSQNSQVPVSVSPDGQALVFMEINRETQNDLWILPLAGDRKPRFFLRSAGAASFSPDGDWLAYGSVESGRPEIYVQPFPAGGQKVQLSSDGGREPHWTSSGEVFYRNGDGMMSVKVQTKPTLAVGRPTLVFEGRYEGAFDNYDVTADGQRFLMLKPVEQEPPTQISVVLNWFEELKRRVPASK